MAKKQQILETPHDLSRREREIMNILYRLGEATVSDVLAEMEAPLSYSAVRSTLNILRGKDHLTVRHDRNQYVYRPTVDRTAARRSALDQLLNTFFDGSAADAVTALLEEPGHELSPDELKQLSTLIRQARREGR